MRGKIAWLAFDERSGRDLVSFRDCRNLPRNASVPAALIELLIWTSPKRLRGSTGLHRVTLRLRCIRKSPRHLHLKIDAQICFGASAKWSGAVSARVAAEGPAVLTRLS